MISVEVLKTLLAYDEIAGSLRWLPRTRDMFPSEGAFVAWESNKAGTLVDCVPDDRGYLKITILNRTYRTQRVCWALATGGWPIGQIDHINGDRTDNRLENLRDVSHAENGKNQKLKKNNTSGYSGVRWNEKSRLWIATIRDDGKRVHLKASKDFDTVLAARREAEIRLGYHPNHGRTGRLATQGEVR